MKMLSQLIVCMLIVGSSVSFAGETELIVSIDKEGVSAGRIQKTVKALNYTTVSTGLCFVESTVTDYIDYSMLEDAPYYGVVILSLKWECDDVAQKFLNKVEKSKKYTIYSNAGVGPTPAVSGSNNIFAN